MIDNPELRGIRFRQHSPKALALDVAENILLMKPLRDLIASPPIQLTRHDLNYPHDSVGEPIVRSQIAALLSQTWRLEGGHELTKEHVLCTPGATAALHLHAKARLSAGDTVLVPAPYWQMFDRIYQDAAVSLHPLPVALGAESSINLVQLQQAHADLVQRGRRPRMLLLTNPHNPLGIIESAEAMQLLFRWVLEETDMEIVSDEIYAHSVFGSMPFVSALALECTLRYRDRVHAVWGLAKDFGLSGWMAGVLLTRSAKLHETITTKFARFSPFDGLKNRILRQLLCEQAGAIQFPLQLLATLPQELRQAQRLVARALQEQGIACASKAHGAPFFWLDLRDYLDADLAHALHPAACVLDGPENEGADPREGRLQKYLACAAALVLLRGQTMHSSEPGFFRLCFSAQPAEEIVSAIERMAAALRLLR